MRTRVKVLGALLLLATFPLLIASIILPRRVQSTLTRLGQANLAHMADDLAVFTQNMMALQLDRVQSFAAQELLRDAILRHNAGALDEGSVAQVNRQLFAMIRDSNTELQGVFLCGRDGFSFAGVLQSGESDPYRHVDVRDRAYFIELQQTRQSVISDPIRSKVQNVPVLVVAAPIFDKGDRFAGFVGISIKLQHLSDLIASRRIGDTGYPFAVDRTGMIVAHPDPTRVFSDVLLRQPAAHRFMARMLAGERGIEPYTSSRGEQKIGAFAPVPICHWTVVTSMLVTEFEAPAHQLRLIIYAMIGACVVVALAAGVAFVVGLERLKLALTDTRASEARFRLFSSVAAGAIWDWDLATNEVWWNDRLEEAFGWRPHEVGSYSDFLELIPAAERGTVCGGWRKALESGQWSGEHSLIRRDGARAYVLNRATVVRDANGKALRVIGGLTDITERRATEQKIAEQAALLDQTRDGIMVIDLKGLVQFWNQGAEKLYGWHTTEAVGRRADELLRMNSEAFAEVCRVVTECGQWFGHLQKSPRSGPPLTIDCRCTLMCDAAGQPKSILAIDTDITERLQMEAKFLRAQRLESIGTLAGGIAHDLNNLLSPILMGVGMLQLSEPGEEDARIIRYIEQSANRGAHLVKQVLSFARGVEGARVSVHVGYVIREIEEIARSTFPKNITFRTEIARDLRLVRADPTQINQVLLNLCVNARDAMPAGGRLSITARNVDLDASTVTRIHETPPGPYILVEVADTGTGMTSEIIEKIFEPFFTTKAPGQGTGLGLSTVLGIVRSHGGTVSVYSEVGKGSVFRIYLPEAATAETAAAVARETDTRRTGHGELILLVDDEPAILNVARPVLEQYGYKVMVASDGAHAFALYHDHRSSIELVITDMMMPLMDGAALVTALRRVDPNVVVIGSSGLSDHHNQIKAAETGIKHFLLKPYATATLIEAVRAALAGRATPSPPVES